MRPFPDSLCHGCVNGRLVPTRRGTIFIQCSHPDLPKYQNQPVRVCPGFVASGPDDSSRN